MSNAWQPQNWEEACKRNAGRRKFHMRKRKERADRIFKILAAMESTPELRHSAYGWLPLTAEGMGTSRATASRDLALPRRIYAQFAQMFGRALEPKRDQIKWSWDWSHYGFRTRESVQAGHRKPVGNFPFDTRVMATDDSYCGFNPACWQSTELDFQLPYPRDLLRVLRSISQSSSR